MKNDNDVIAGGIIWHVAYHPFQYLDMPTDIWCPHRSDNGWMQKSDLDPAMNYQIIVVCILQPSDHEGSI